MKIDINIDKNPISRKFDSSLLDVYVVNFDDNYHRISGEPTSEFESEVRRLKGRYRDLTKFNHALSTYYEWMNHLYDKYGGKDIFKSKRKAGLITDYVPNKPRLKNVKSLKYFYKKGIVLSEVGKDLITDYDSLDETINMFYDQMKYTCDNIDVTIIDDKTANKASNELYGRVREYEASSFVSDVDYLQAYFSNKNKPKKKKGKKKKNKKKKNREDKLLLMDIMNGEYDDYGEESEKAPLTTYNGLLLSSGTTKELDVYHKLSELGWDSYKIMKKAKYGKRVTSMFKVQKKKKKKKGKPSSYDDLLVDIMTDNNYDDFESFQREMLDMTSDNIFK